MPDVPDQASERKLCPVCGHRSFAAFSRVVHEDGAVVVYSRCADCSHVRVEEEQEPVRHKR